jgi:hypothetical protein
MTEIFTYYTDIPKIIATDAIGYYQNTLFNYNINDISSIVSIVEGGTIVSTDLELFGVCGAVAGEPTGIWSGEDITAVDTLAVSFAGVPPVTGTCVNPCVAPGMLQPHSKHLVVVSADI